MEIVITLFVLVGVSLALSAWKMKNAPDATHPGDQRNDPVKVPGLRTCLACGYQGEMKTWIANYPAPKVLLVVGFLLGYLPGLVFLAIYWGKHKCPSCGAVGKNQQAP